MPSETVASALNCGVKARKGDHKAGGRINRRDNVAAFMAVVVDAVNE
jgi:hypothetical protein